MPILRPPDFRLQTEPSPGAPPGPPARTNPDGSTFSSRPGSIPSTPMVVTTRVGGPMTWRRPPYHTPIDRGVSLWVDGQTLRLSSGVAVQWHGIENLWGPTSAGNLAAAVAAVRGFGANAMGPIFQTAQSTAANVRAVISANAALGMMTGVNADAYAAPAGRTWLKQPDIVAECNAGRGVVIQCETELGGAPTQTEWRDAAIAFVIELRAAGHKSPIKVGSTQGGRRPRHALSVGKEVLAADPLRSLIFTWQAYWGAATGGFQYSTLDGFTAEGTAGALECVTALKNSGLYWIVGLDGADDIGNTPYIELATQLHANGLGWQWWAMFVGDAYGNGLTSDPLTSVPKAPFGATVQGLLQSQAQVVAL